GKHDRINNDGVWQSKETVRTDGIHQCRHRDHGISRIEITTDQEPGNPGTEVTATQAPLIKMSAFVRLAALPARCGKAHYRHQQKEEDKNAQRRPVDLTFHYSSPLLFSWR